MNIAFKRDGDYGILTFSGNIEKLSIKMLKNQLDMVVSQACPYMIVDLRGVSRLSTSGLGLIFAGRNKLEDLGILMALVGETKEFNRLLPPGNMEKMVPLTESIERAKIALRRMDFERKADVRRRQRHKK